MKLWSGGTAMHLLPASPPTLPQDSENCFFCNSWDRGGHGIEKVISQSGPRGNQTWWQAESGEGAGVPGCEGLGSGVKGSSL